MLEECFVAGAQIVQSGFAIGRENEAIAGTFPMAGKTHLALATVTWQRISLVLSKLELLRRVEELDQGRLLDIAELKARFYEVVARIGSPLCSRANACPQVSLKHRLRQEHPPS